MDVSQLPVTQVTNKDNSSLSCVESDENGHFKTVMDDVLASDDLNPEAKTEEAQTAQTDEKSDGGQETPVALPIIIPTPQPVSPDTGLVDGEIPLISVDSALPAEENPHLAWFNATSFQPPQAGQTVLTENDTLPADMAAAEITPAQEFIIAPSQTTTASPVPATGSTETTSAKVNGAPVPLINELSGNKKEAEAGMEFFKDKLFAMAESINRSEKNPATDAAANHFNMVMATANQTKIHTPPPPQAPSPLRAFELPVLVDSPEWGQQFSQQITWQGLQKIDRAVIRLNPQELGPLEVNIKLHKEEASVTITTHTLHVRDIIEQAIPRLRDMMSEQGINLSQFNIESNANQHQSGQQNNPEQNGIATAAQGQEESSQDVLTIKNSSGLIDYFA